MALTADWRGCVAVNDLSVAERDTLTILTMVVGVGDVTGEHADEYAARVQTYERLNGALLRDGDGNDAPITSEQIAKIVGMRTNVAYEPRDRWLARIVGQDIDRAARAFTPNRPAVADPEPTRAPKVSWGEAHDMLVRLVKDAAREAGDADLAGYVDDSHSALDDVLDRAVRAANLVLADAYRDREDDGYGVDVERAEARIGA